MGVRLLVVDALNLIRRVYAATPESDEPGHSMQARGASVQSLRRALKATSPTHAVCVFDCGEPTWRHRLYPDYKAGRKPMPEPLRRDLDRYRESFLELGVASVSKPELEADDVIATLARKAAASGGRVVILSTDKILCQLVSDDVIVLDHFQSQELDRAYVTEKFGVPPEQLVDLWALAGSATTNIPGVPKVGVKTAAKLLHEHGSLERVLAAAGAIGGKVGESLSRHADRALLSRELASLRGDLELGWNLKSFLLLTPRTS